MSSRPDPRLTPLVEAALSGARAAMEVYAGDFVIERKQDNSPVSEADRAAERAIVAHLSAAMPDIPIVAEEACAGGGAPRPGRVFLLVDPLDGTKEFISRNGEFTVNIALIEDGAPVLGVVLAPALSLAYAGGAGETHKGGIDPGFECVKDWQRIKARPAASPPLAVASRSHLTPATEEALRLAGAKDCRSIGSSLKLCLLAEGEADFYPRLGPTMEWDIAAGDAVLRAAGGAVITLEGTPLRYGKTGVPGMRDFENPFFLAAGDPGLLARLALERLRANEAV
jgi:3'(2'), 5'-bisphosphate nucleotidase